MDQEILNAIEPWLGAAAILTIAIVVAYVGHRILFAVLERLSRRTTSRVDDSLVLHGRRPSLLILLLFVLYVVLQSFDLPDNVTTIIRHAGPFLIATAFGWLAFSLSRTIEDVVAANYDITAADNLRARQMHTRIRLLQRIVRVVIVAVTVSIVLMTIPGIRQIGVTLFASAGLAGIIAGLAARPVLSNVLAGVQLALTQPIRIDDVVIVEGEWGWIEEIRMTFVVVRIWDLRRLIVPLTYFIETPFENWTRRNADILGTVFLYTDYTVPVGPVRQELDRILENTDLWNGTAAGLQVTNTTESTVELRALMSARNSGDAWNLRCHVREKLVEFLQREYPDALPRLRAEVRRDPSSSSEVSPEAPPSGRVDGPEAGPPAKSP